MDDKVVIVSQAMLGEYADIDLDKVKFSHFPLEIYRNIWEADVIIVYDEHTARIMRNRFSNRKDNIRADNVGSWVKARMYRADR